MEIGDYILCSKIGAGADATVYCGHRKNSKETLAIKVIHKKFDEDDKKLSAEADALKNLCHPNIERYVDSFDTPESFCIVTELLTNGSLLDRVNKHGPFSPMEARTMFMQLLDALHYIHSEKGLVHRDLKCENVMFDNMFCPKLIDFGYCKQQIRGKFMTTFCGSFPYLPPEIIKGEAYTNKCDVWELGIIFYAALHGELPFYDANDGELFKKIVFTQPKYSQNLPQQAIYLLERMLEKDPMKRISIEECKEEAFFAPSRIANQLPALTKVETMTTAKLPLPLVNIQINTNRTSVLLQRKKPHLKPSLFVLNQLNKVNRRRSFDLC